MALKFAGRTPSSSLRRPHRVLSREQASQRVRAWAIRGALFSLIALVLTTMLRAQIGGAPVSSTGNASHPGLSWQETAGALWLLVGETLRLSGTRGALVSLSALFVALLLWLALSFLGEWRKAPIGFLLLLALQFFGWGFHVANVRAPATTTIEYSKSVHEALDLSWNLLSRAQQINVVLSALLVVSLLWWWGAGLEPRAARWSGPQRAQGFLRRRRLSYQLSGALLMLFAFAGTLLLGAILFGKTLRLTPLSTPIFSWLTPPIAFLLCVLSDAIYLQGRRLWRRLS